MTARTVDDDRDELAWLAFQYVADELGPDALAAFEVRLDHDQAAREAVAEAVALAATLALAVPAHRRGVRRRRRVLAVAALAAVAVLVVASPWSRSRSRPGLAQAPVAGETDSRKTMALAWSVLWQTSDASTETETGTETDPIIPLDGLIAHVDEPGALDRSQAERSDDLGIPPAWMVEGAYVHDMLHPRGPGS